ncbi:alpha/beta hydrolase [Occultella glacieicola]|uniref:Alpha/beta hydrolase n=1 Tax=Occultella glacieicola TaxID=2518684 RepID=A0ABY2E5Y7_9MICO|nr:alpha/beta hydrolase [Occultella glacieicola]TDE96005.1 alpha/beta hydrolase [Occultella glacieicola]
MSALALHRYGPEADAGIPLVLLHGFPFDSRMWSYVVTSLPLVPVVAVDAPGFGASPALPDGGLEAFADEVASSLAGVGITRAVVAGLSMGGYVALALAERHPDLLAGIALLDSKASSDDEAGRAKRLEVARAARGAAGADGAAGAAVVAPMLATVLGDTTRAHRPEVVREVKDWLAQAPPAAIAWAQESMAVRPDRHAALEGLAGRRVPALVLRGTEDTMASADDHERMARALGVDVSEVPESGHLSAVETPQPVAHALAALRHTVSY